MNPGPRGLQRLCHAGDGQGHREALHHAASRLKKSSAQDRGIIITEPRKGQWLGHGCPELNKEDYVPVLARECNCPHCA